MEFERIMNFATKLKSVLVGITAFGALMALASGVASATTLTTSSSPVTPNMSGALIAGGVSLGAVSNAPQSTGANPSDPSGWDPWGSTDTNSNWLSVGGCCGGASSAIFNTNAPANDFSLLWGSPNSDNTITLYSGANGTGSVVATVDFVDGTGFYVDGVLSTQPFGPNITDPGYIETILTSTLFDSAVLTSDIGGFEVADVSASLTPLPATLPLFATGFAGLGLLGWRRKRKNASALAA
jgi:hypothetical protein